MSSWKKKYIKFNVTMELDIPDKGFRSSTTLRSFKSKLEKITGKTLQNKELQLKTGVKTIKTLSLDLDLESFTLEDFGIEDGMTVNISNTREGTTMLLNDEDLDSNQSPEASNIDNSIDNTVGVSTRSIAKSFRYENIENTHLERSELELRLKDEMERLSKARNHKRTLILNSIPEISKKFKGANIRKLKGYAAY